MAQAILINGGLNIDPEALNSIIEEYKSSTEIISANTFVDFVNNSTIEYSETKNLYNATHVGYIVSNYIEQTANQFYDTQAQHPYYLTQGAHTFKNAVFQLDDETLLYFHTNQESQGGYYNHVIMLTIKDKTITLNKAQQLPGLGSNLAALQMSNTRFFIASGSYRTNTSNSYIINYMTLDVDLEDKTFTLNTAYHNSRYYYITFTDMFKVDDNTVIVFMADGNGSSRYYHTCFTMTINANGTITANHHLLEGHYTDQAGQYYYEVHQINPKKYVEICHYNYPIFNIVVVNDDKTVTRSGYVLPSAIAAYTNLDLVGQSFAYKNYAYSTYYDGSNWVMVRVDCNGTAPIVMDYQSLGAAGSSRPIICQVSENQVIALQFNANLGYATLIQFDEEDGGFHSSSITLTVGFRIANVLKYVQTGEKQGYVICQTYGQTQGLVAIPMVYDRHIVTCGEAQMWNDSFNWNASYTYFYNVRNGSSICVFQPYNYNAYNSINCFAIYQDGLTLRRGAIHTLYKGDTYATTTCHSIRDVKIDHETGEVVILFRDFELASTSYYDLYITNVFVIGAESYPGTVEKIRNGADTSNRNFAYARLLRTSKNDYAAIYNHTDAWFSATAIKLEPKLNIITAEETGYIAGWTKTMCAPDKAGKVVLVSKEG